MKKEYNFVSAKPNPYAAKLRKQISIRLDIDTVSYFKNEAQKTGVPYQKLINLYLAHCASNSKKLEINWH
jgi:predicted DNA binding CopG/RHH family protein